MPEKDGKAELLQRIEALQQRIAELEKALHDNERSVGEACRAEAAPARADPGNDLVFPHRLDAAWLALIEYAADHSLDELLSRSLDMVATFVESPIGFFHVVAPDQGNLSRHHWICRAPKDDCGAQSKYARVAMDRESLWADFMEVKQPTLYNDQASLPFGEKLPEGHVGISRLLVVPVLREDAVVALMGVGNKTSEYVQKDVEIVTLLSGATWEILRHKQTETALREKQAFQNTLLDAIPLPVFYKDAAGRYLGINRAFEIFTGKTKHQVIGKTVFDIQPPALAKIYRARDSELLKDGGLQQFVSQAQNARGEIREVLYSKALFKNDQGAVDGLIGTMLDVTERKRTEAALRESEERYRTIFRNSPLGIFRSTIEGRLLEVNPAVAEMLGYDSPDAVLREIQNIGAQINIGVESRLRLFSDQLHRAGTTRHFEHFRRKDGSEFIANLYLKTIRDAQDRPLFLEGIIEDITERKKLEEQLRHAQKMEAIGRLAGGVAHDFNNMLGVILGHAELAMAQVRSNQPLFHDLQEIREAACRSADLTRQLLAFARKQTVTPRLLDLNEMVGGMLKMLRPLIGEDIDLVWLPGAALQPIKMDPSQIDQILANLFVNARDAISGVGKITIETGMVSVDDAYCAVHSELRPGRYIALAVSDDGHGMDKKTQDKIFEPFFTTKIKGKGTGLGLATIYGIVRQNDGFINVFSEPEQGTTFKIFLPAQAPGSERTGKKDLAEPAAPGHETILLVEDEPTLLDMGRLMLEKLGYLVLTAAMPGAAIRLANEYAGEIHLLMTDVVMPEMNGRDLAKNLIRLRPGIKRLFMSGYTGDIIAHHGVLDEGVYFIQKPFSIQDLALKVREALDSE